MGRKHGILRKRGILGESDFLKLWIGQTVSVFDSNVSFVALPLTAILVLDASPMQMGLLKAAGELPYFIAALFIGVIVDRFKRRPLMIAVDLGCAALIGLIPLLAVSQWLNIYHLYTVALGVGILSVLFDSAYQAYLPTLVGRERLVATNSSLQFSTSLSQVAGPGLAGFLVSLLTAPLSLVVNSFSFLVSAGSLVWIKRKENFERRQTESSSFFKESKEGLKVLLRHPVLRPLTLAMGGISMFFNAFLAVYFLYLNDEISLSSTTMGLVLSLGALGATTGGYS